MKLPQVKKDTCIKYGIGIGLGLFSLDHYPINLIGLLILFVFVVIYTKDSNIKIADLGSKWVYIPMLSILLITILRLAIYHTINELFAVSFFAIMLGLYVISRKMGKEIVKVLLPLFIIVAASVFIMAIVNIGEETSGIVGQYNRTAGLLAYIIVLNRNKWQWLLAIIGTLAILLTGSLEGVIILCALSIVVLCKRDWSRKLWIPLGMVTLALIVLALTGNLGHLYTPVIDNLHLTGGMQAETALNGRVIVYKNALQNISLLGHGYTNSLFTSTTVHNVPLIVFDQLGIFAGIAWIVLTGYCLIKTKWHYVWVVIIAMCLFDHFVWTGLAPLYFVAVGVTTANKENDYIFRLKGD